MLTELEKQIVRELQKGLPLVSQPYLELSGRLGMSETELMEKIKEFLERGLLRRLGAAVRHQDLGYVANAMIVWEVPGEQVLQAGQTMSDFAEVSHCYQRPVYADWPYNLFTMVHGQDEAACQKIAERLSQATGIKKYKLLFSTAELKKSTMKYFV
ncbi:putative transcriptional regulator, AsnC family [Desulfofarcimen acetoxidans DSM 771]|jgi:DNA-binding Lrp family transcriptional regulator|uniref:siroheme decarboxylase n=1 Tax=Desulfofarcimen acetoxidans (strain ATCC 49208 / DSM 771 / KCTC 5769 / VKM B-1644 / 5575) TaxID=485916 RepID=C8W5F7_DESAS|nr:Lrp/AsnC family transcriptional regulator [Desulfofarcimen acetoxidans]ACV62139.1 putative transcriptional regulator, AsnC family [Desulfofarcimen acetoxidans DSM 771]